MRSSAATWAATWLHEKILTLGQGKPDGKPYYVCSQLCGSWLYGAKAEEEDRAACKCSAPWKWKKEESAPSAQHSDIQQAVGRLVGLLEQEVRA